MSFYAIKLWYSTLSWGSLRKRFLILTALWKHLWPLKNHYWLLISFSKLQSSSLLRKKERRWSLVPGRLLWSRVFYGTWPPGVLFCENKVFVRRRVTASKNQDVAYVSKCFKVTLWDQWIIRENLPFVSLLRAYDDLWLRGQVELADLLPVELPKDPPKPEKVICPLEWLQYCAMLANLPFSSIQDKLVAFQKFATMYIKYILIFRKLEESYDQVGAPTGTQHCITITYACVCLLSNMPTSLLHACMQSLSWYVHEDSVHPD